MSAVDLQRYKDGEVAMSAVLDGIPDEETRGFETLLTELATLPDRKRVIGDLRSILESGEDSERTYAAFYGLNIILRRNHDFTLLEELMVTGSLLFKGHPTFQHLLILFRIGKGLGPHYDEVVSMAYDDSLRFPEHAGVIHLFADTVATIA